MARKKKEAVPEKPKDLRELTVLNKIHQEYLTGLRNNEQEDAEFEAILDLLECKRNERDGRRQQPRSRLRPDRVA